MTKECMKIFTIALEVYEDITIEQIEKVIDDGLNNAGIDCSYNVEEKMNKETK